MKIIALFLASAGLGVVGAAQAQDADYAFVERTNASVPPPPSDAIAPAALATLQAMAREENRCVPTAVQLRAPETAIAVRVITEAVAAGQIKNGWTVYGRAEGCPEPTVTRFMVLRMADDSLRALVVNDGETLANPALMRDSSAAAAMAAFQRVLTVDAACTGQDMRMGPTRVTERGADLGPNFHGAYYAGSWTEAWTFITCGRRVEVPVAFTADGQGGAHFNIRGSEARIVE